MTSQSEIFGVGAGGGGGFYPSIQQPEFFPLTASNANFWSINARVLPWGFVGDGDYFLIPWQNLGELEYYDAGGSLIWSLIPSDVITGGTDWAGFRFLDTKMIAVVRISGEYHMTEIDVDGNVVDNGNDTPGGGLANVRWASPHDSANSGNVFPYQNDDVELIVMLTNASQGSVSRQRISDGQFVQSPVNFDLSINFPNRPTPASLQISVNGAFFYQPTANTLAFGMSSVSGALFDVATIETVFNSTMTEILGARMPAGYKPISYKNSAIGADLVCYMNQNNETVDLTRVVAFGRQELSDWIDAMATIQLGGRPV